MKFRLALVTAACCLSLLALVAQAPRVSATQNCNIGNVAAPSGCAQGCLDFGYGPVTSEFPCGTFAVLLEKRPPGGTWSYTGKSSQQHSDIFQYCPPAGTFEYRFKLICKFCGPTVEFYDLGTFTCP